MKTIIKGSSLSVLLFTLSLQVNAATLIESEDDQGGVQKMWVQGSKMRMETGNDKEYMLADYANKKVLIVDPAKKEMIDISHFMTETSDSAKGLKVRVKHEGGGPKVAGYATQKYTLMVNGRVCSKTLVSAKALKDSKLGPMLDAMGKIEMNPMGSQNMSECDRADLVFSQRLKKLGMPLGTINKQGKIIEKVLRIVSDVKPPAGGFNPPSGYRSTTMQQKMQEAMGAGMPPGAAGKMDPAMKKAMEEMMRQQGR